MSKKDSELGQDVVEALKLELKEANELYQALVKLRKAKLAQLKVAHAESSRSLMSLIANQIKPYEAARKRAIASNKQHMKNEFAVAQTRYQDSVAAAQEFRDVAEEKATIFYKEACAAARAKFEKESDRLHTQYKKDLAAEQKKQQKELKDYAENSFLEIEESSLKIAQIESQFLDIEHSEAA